jgi:hypothetical protein
MPVLLFSGSGSRPARVWAGTRRLAGSARHGYYVVLCLYAESSDGEAVWYCRTGRHQVAAIGQLAPVSGIADTLCLHVSGMTVRHGLPKATVVLSADTQV